MAEGEVRENFWSRAVGATRRLLVASSRGKTDLEHRLASDVDDLRAELARVRAEFSDQAARNAILESSVRVARQEILLLACVIERDRLRIESEATAYGRRVADNKEPPT